MYKIKKAVSSRQYDLFVNGIHVMRDTKQAVNTFVNSHVKPLGLEESK